MAPVLFTGVSYSCWKNSINSPSGPTQKAMRTGVGVGALGMVSDVSSIWHVRKSTGNLPPPTPESSCAGCTHIWHMNKLTRACSH